MDLGKVRELNSNFLYRKSADKQQNWKNQEIVQSHYLEIQREIQKKQLQRVESGYLWT